MPFWMPSHSQAAHLHDSQVSFNILPQPSVSWWHGAIVLTLSQALLAILGAANAGAVAPGVAAVAAPASRNVVLRVGTAGAGSRGGLPAAGSGSLQPPHASGFLTCLLAAPPLV